MGVSGSGKSTVGRILADRLHCPFFDADDYHPEANKKKMHAGHPLTDEDRAPWLERLRELIDAAGRKSEPMVLACSCLKESYRQALVDQRSDVSFIFLKADFQTISQRLAARQHAFMNPGLLQSQFETLEAPQEAVVIDATQPPDQIVHEILKRIS